MPGLTLSDLSQDTLGRVKKHTALSPDPGVPDAGLVLALTGSSLRGGGAGAREDGSMGV
jgi:hypothetical protein